MLPEPVDRFVLRDLKLIEDAKHAIASRVITPGRERRPNPFREQSLAIRILKGQAATLEPDLNLQLSSLQRGSFVGFVYRELVTRAFLHNPGLMWRGGLCGLQPGGHMEQLGRANRQMELIVGGLDHDTVAGLRDLNFLGWAKNDTSEYQARNQRGPC